jgi:cation-transporting ATPase I
VVATGVGSAALLVAIVQTPGVSAFFGCRPLGPVAWATVAGSAAAATVGAAVADRFVARSAAMPAAGDARAPATDRLDHVPAPR